MPHVHAGFSPADARVLLAAAVIAGVLLALAAVLAELAGETQRVEEAVIRLDAAAYQISDVIEEARRITADAAGGAR